MTRLWSEGQPITASSDAQGNPRSFNWHGVTHQVLHITQAWRVDLEWWRSRTWRAYFKLTTHTGMLLILYQDLSTGEWFVQRVYD